MSPRLIPNTYCSLKTLVEKFLGITIYRHSTPWGMSLKNDLRRLAPNYTPTVIFDIGANIGEVASQFSIDYRSATIHAFEPIPSTYTQLCRNVRRHASIKAHNVAIGEACGKSKMIAMDNSVLSRVITPMEKTTEASDHACMDVEMSTIHEFCMQNSLSHINILKSDTEGHELSVLRGAEPLLSAHAVDFILVEAIFPPSKHTQWVLNYDIADYLGKFGYRCIGIYDQRYISSWNLFYGNMLLASPRF